MSNVSYNSNRTKDMTRTEKHGGNYVVVEILRTFARYPLLTSGVFLVVAAAVIVSLLPPLVLGRIIDDITDGKAITFARIGVYFGLLVAAGVLEFMQEALLVVLGQKMTHGLRSSLSYKLSRLSADDLNKQEPGAVVSRFVGDVDTVEDLFTSGIISMMADACKILGILAIILTKSLGLVLVLCVIVPIIYAFTRHVQKQMLQAHVANRAAVSKVSNHVPETIRCIRTIQNLGKESFMEEKYDGYIQESYDSIEKTNFYEAIYSPIILILNAVVVAIVMLLAASNNKVVLSLFGMSVGTSVAIINYISQIFAPIESLGMEIQTIQSALVGLYRIDEFLKRPEREEVREGAGEEREILKEAGEEIKETREDAGAEIKETSEYIGADKECTTRRNTVLELTQKSEPENGKDDVAVVTDETSDVKGETALVKDEIMNMPDSAEKPCIELKDVVFGYDKRLVLDGMNLKIYPGEHVTLVGKTGAGKSTVFRLLLGLYRPQKGHVQIMGREASLIQDHEKRHLFGYVEQKFHLVPGTVKDQITLYDDIISMDMVEEACRLTGLVSTIEELEYGYDTPCNLDIFSQGQWQLLSIARAVAANPKILLLDEITANLDADTEAHVLNAISNVAQGRTVLSISHRLNLAVGEGEHHRVVRIG